MPEISRINGIIIKMFYADHPPKHFHAEYGKNKALFSIDKLELLEGELPPKDLKIVKDWAKKHKSELLQNWDRAVKREKLEKIESTYKKEAAKTTKHKKTK